MGCQSEKMLWTTDDGDGTVHDVSMISPMGYPKGLTLPMGYPKKGPWQSPGNGMTCGSGAPVY